MSGFRLAEITPSKRRLVVSRFLGRCSQRNWFRAGAFREELIRKRPIHDATSGSGIVRRPF